MLVTGGRYRHRSRGTARLCARQKPSATPTWCHPTTCSGSIPAPITAVAASAPPQTPVTIRSCCSAFCPAAPNRTVVGWSVPAPDRRRLERGRVRRPQREPAQPRQALGGAGEGDAVWAGPHVRFAGEFHRIDNAGINPRPASGRVPIWCMAGTPKRPSSAAQNMATATCRSSIPRVRPPSRRLPNYGH